MARNWRIGIWRDRHCEVVGTKWKALEAPGEVWCQIRPLVSCLQCSGTRRTRSCGNCGWSRHDSGAIVRDRKSLKLYWVTLLQHTQRKEELKQAGWNKSTLCGTTIRWAFGQEWGTTLGISKKTMEKILRFWFPSVRLVGNSSSVIRSLKANMTLFYSSTQVRPGIYLIIVFRQNTGEKLCSPSALSPCCWSSWLCEFLEYISPLSISHLCTFKERFNTEF